MEHGRETEEELSRRDLVRGYEFEKNRYVLMDDEDFAAARIESSSTMAIVKIVDRATINPIYFDTSYYLAPDGEAGQDVHVVLREAIAKANKAALSHVMFAHRERAAAILPMEEGMVLHTLHEPRDLYEYGTLFNRISHDKPDTGMVKLATQLVERQVGKFEPADMEDRYEARLREVVAAKLKGEGISPSEPEAPRGDNVVDLMAALKRSLGQQQRGQQERAPPRRSAPAKRKAAPKKAARKRA